MSRYDPLINWCEQQIAQLHDQIAIIETGGARYSRKTGSAPTVDITEEILSRNKRDVEDLGTLMSELKGRSES